jgi:hypothetical protein
MDGGWRMADDGPGLVDHHKKENKGRERNVLCLYPYAFNVP